MAEPGGDIIIKKIKKVSGGHHGGAWKVAYADFVTAMMAFFLLLWLLSSTTQVQKQGLAEYFTPTFGLKDSKGVGIKGGVTSSLEGESQTNLTDPGIVVGRVPQGPDPTMPTQKIDDIPKSTSSGLEVPLTASSDQEGEKQDNTGDSGSADADNAEFKRVEEDIMNAFEQTPELQDFKNNIIITNTPEGLRIDMVDDQKRPMFSSGSAMMTKTGEMVLSAIGNIVATTPNKISLSGHTDASGFSVGNYTNWELSSDRANASRRFLNKDGVEAERMAKVQGMADRDLLVPNEPNSPRNRRISLVLMRGTHSKPGTKPTSRGLLSVPDVKRGASE